MKFPALPSDSILIKVIISLTSLKTVRNFFSFSLITFSDSFLLVISRIMAVKNSFLSDFQLTIEISIGNSVPSDLIAYKSLNIDESMLILVLLISKKIFCIGLIYLFGKSDIIDLSNKSCSDNLNIDSAPLLHETIFPSEEINTIASFAELNTERYFSSLSFKVRFDFSICSDKVITTTVTK